MAKVYVFADEAGDFTFKRKQGASQYFIIGSVTMNDCRLGHELLELRREIAWRGALLDAFHCTQDRQWIRDAVFQRIASSELRIDATILDKARTQEHLVRDPLRFYKTAFYLHMKYVVPRVSVAGDDVMVVASSLQVKKKRRQVGEAVDDVITQVAHGRKYIAAFHAASTDPCLQAADYATWAIQRKYESNDARAFETIQHLVRSEFSPFHEVPRY